ncbi:MAG TPA: hypothetical protein ENI29_17195 [bacterium]|nr:hypothetical protein [bacterium]
MSTLNASAWSITDQPGDQSWVSTKTQAVRVTYKTDAVNVGIQAVVQRTPIDSISDTCDPGSSSGSTIGGGHTWWGGDFVLDLRAQMNYRMSLDKYDDPNIAFDTEDGNGYICVLIKVKFISQTGSIWSNEIRVKVYKLEVPSGGLFAVPLPIYVPIIALGMLVLIKKKKKFNY